MYPTPVWCIDGGYAARRVQLQKPLNLPKEMPDANPTRNDGGPRPHAVASASFTQPSHTSSSPQRRPGHFFFSRALPPYGGNRLGSPPGRTRPSEPCTCTWTCTFGVRRCRRQPRPCTAPDARHRAGLDLRLRRQPVVPCRGLDGVEQGGPGNRSARLVACVRVDPVGGPGFGRAAAVAHPGAAADAACAALVAHCDRHVPGVDGRGDCGRAPAAYGTGAGAQHAVAGTGAGGRPHRPAVDVGGRPASDTRRERGAAARLGIRPHGPCAPGGRIARSHRGQPGRRPLVGSLGAGRGGRRAAVPQRHEWLDLAKARLGGAVPGPRAGHLGRCGAADLCAWRGCTASPVAAVTGAVPQAGGGCLGRRGAGACGGGRAGATCGRAAAVGRATGILTPTRPR